MRPIRLDRSEAEDIVDLIEVNAAQNGVLLALVREQWGHGRTHPSHGREHG